MQIHEFSYQWDPSKVIPKQADEVLRIGSAKKSTTVLKDMALNNDAMIHGAMRVDGFLAGGRRFDGVNDYLECGNDVSIQQTESITMSALIWKTQFLVGLGEHIIGRSYTSMMYVTATGELSWFIATDTEWKQLITSMIMPLNEWVYVECTYKSSGNPNRCIYVNGEIESSDNAIIGDIKTSTQKIYIGYQYATERPFEDSILCPIVRSGFTTLSESVERFNTLAVLPFYRHVFTDYSNNATSLTTTFPGSSGIINSGSFNRTDGLKCTSAGTIVFSAANKFDGAEYIKVKIDGIWYAGTGTITQGTVTVAVSQGSNDITVSMGTNDVVQEILINFRAEV